MPVKNYSIAIVGAGVTGTALGFTLARYSNVDDIVIIEKNPGPAEVNSHPLFNAQTSHDGGTETNYSLSHALDVQKAALMLRNYVTAKNAPGLYRRTNRMALGIGAEEVEKIRARYEKFHPYYPDLSLADGKELEAIEPMVMKGRNPNEPVLALVSNLGFAVNYQRLAECFIEDIKGTSKRVDISFNTKVESIRRENDLYVIETGSDSITASVVVFASGPYSLAFAQKLGYGLDLGILSVAGSFFSSRNFLKGKVYRMQVEGRPFAEIHGDPDVLSPQDTRFGPTTKPLPLMERYHYGTFFDYLKLPIVSFKGAVTLTRILWKDKLVGYVLKNYIYEVPVLGQLAFLHEAKKIVPTIKFGDLKRRRHAGGVRPQIVNLKTGKLEMGDSSIVGDRDGDKLIFNTTPSPGASICLSNAKRDAERVVSFLGGAYRFDKDAFERDLQKPLAVAA